MSDEEEQLSAEEVERRAAKAAAKSKASGDDAPGVPPTQRPALAEGLVQGDSDDDVPVGDSAPSGAHSIPASDPGAGASGGSGSLEDRVDQLKEVIDSLKASLHAERQSAADKDVQIHKLLEERDFVVGAFLFIQLCGSHSTSARHAAHTRLQTSTGARSRRMQTS